MRALVPLVPRLGPVDSSEIVKGYEYQKGRYVTVEPDDLSSAGVAWPQFEIDGLQRVEGVLGPLRLL